MFAISSILLGKVDERRAQLPVPWRIVLPDGQRIGTNNPRLEIHIREARAWRPRSNGKIGTLAEDFVKGLADILGSLCDFHARGSSTVGRRAASPAGQQFRTLVASRASRYLGAYPSRSGEGGVFAPA